MKRLRFPKISEFFKNHDEARSSSTNQLNSKIIYVMLFIYLLFFLGFFDGTLSLLLFFYHVTCTPHLTSLTNN